MSQSWTIYTTASPEAATSAVKAMYATLAGIVGEDLAEHLEPGEELEPPSLGFWPDVSVASTPVPKSAGKGKDFKHEGGAVERLKTCKATIRIDRAERFDPALISAMRALFESLGPCLFTKGQDLLTSETLLATVLSNRDLAAALRAIAAGEQIDEEEEDEDEEEEEDEDEEEEDDEEAEEDDEPAPDSAKPEMLRMILGEIAQIPRARRKAAELLGGAPPLVGTFAERLARVGAEPDPVAAKALAVTERDIVGARKALAIILRRSEGR
jgi:hypothetical protein